MKDIDLGMQELCMTLMIVACRGPNPFEGVSANGMRGAVRPVATFATKVAAMQQAQWNNGSGPGRPVRIEPLLLVLQCYPSLTCPLR